VSSIGLTPEALGILTDEVRKGVGASTLQAVLGPILKDRIELALNNLEHCPNDLGSLLDLRARITSLRQLERELKSAIIVGNEASQKL